MTWTHFWDMSSGGSHKTDFHHIFVEAPKSDAVAWFETRFGQSPFDVACDCCGENFSVDERKTLDEATAYHRGCDLWRDGRYVERPGHPVASVEEYSARADVLVVRASELEKAVAP